MERISGQCLCGDVTMHATPVSEQIDACHCSACRKWAAGPYTTLTCEDDVSFDGEASLGVFKSSQWAERVFCKTCGTSMAWRLQQGGAYHVNSQVFSETQNWPLAMQVFIDEKPSNYSFAEQTETMTGAEVFAAFSGEGEKNA